tara:strand:- start:4 stop:456 length:453 start_codon:yes stop_codon:yes gene_type:complete
MPDCPMVQIHKKIVELIAVNYSGLYANVDLTNNVIRGMVDQPPVVPYGCVRFVDAPEDYGPTMGRFQGTAQFDAFGFIGGGSSTERTDNALNLASDMITKITANRQLSLGTLVDDVLCNFSAIDGEAVGISGVGICLVRISVRFRSETGV